jgi:Vitamin K-dependent gamma-carboxylase, lumenal domain
VILGAYVVWQLLMPLRPFLYSNNPSWSDEAHFFSWRMMLRDKTTTEARMLIHNPASLENQLVDPSIYMESWQSTIMNRNPELIRQFAWFVAERARLTGQTDEPRIYARVFVSLNGREPSLLIDPSVNLAEQSWSIGPADWIMPAPIGPPR